MGTFAANEFTEESGKLDRQDSFHDFESEAELKRIQKQLFAKGYAWPTGHTKITTIRLGEQPQGRIWAGYATTVFDSPLGNDGLTLYLRVQHKHKQLTR